MPMRNKATLIAVMVSLSVAGAFAADWPWIRPTEPDIGREAPAADLAQGRPQGPLEGGRGHRLRGPAISGGKVYLLDRDDKVGDTLRVYDLATGKALWTFAYDAPGSFMFNGSRTTPTVDGDRVYTVGPLGDLYCISTKSQKPVWHKNIWTDFGGGATVPTFREPPPGFGQPGAARGGAPAGPPGGQPALGAACHRHLLQDSRGLRAEPALPPDLRLERDRDLPRPAVSCQRGE
jgi:hypothetical protein